MLINNPPSDQYNAKVYNMNIILLICVTWPTELLCSADPEPVYFSDLTIFVSQELPISTLQKE